MRFPARLWALGLPATAALLLSSALTRGPVQAEPPQSISLMQTLEDWKYPDAGWLGGQMNDGGFRGIQTVNCRAILTTPDSFEKVVKFYSDKFLLDPETGERLTKTKREPPPQSITSQDDSQGRPVKVRVLVVNRAETSTTLVITRAEDEGLTHITWSHFIRIDLLR